MDADGDWLGERETSAQLSIELLSHYCLQDKPARTLEVLRIFLNERANEVYDELRAGRAVVVRTGPRVPVAQMARSMQAQGFRLRMLPVTDGAGCLPYSGGISG